MARIVCNTGPLIALERIDQLALLQAVFGQVLIPNAVEQEFLAGQPVGSAFFEALAAGWLQVSALAEAPDPLLSRLLDAGEAAVIQLARVQKIEQVLVDERKGRKIARQVYGLRTLGTVRVLLEAKERGLIDAIGSPLAVMREQGYRIHDDIVRAALAQAGEQPPTS